MHDLSQKSEQEMSLKQAPVVNSQFSCNVCRHQASEPVVTQCGHLYCWECVHSERQCKVCGREIVEDEFLPVYTTYETKQSRKIKNEFKPKPRAKNVGKIKNHVALGADNEFSPLFSSLSNNLERGALVAGNSYMPPTVFNLMVRDFFTIQGQCDQDLEEMEIVEKNLKTKITLLSWFLLVLVFGCVVVSLGKEGKQGK